MNLSLLFNRRTLLAATLLFACSAQAQRLTPPPLLPPPTPPIQTGGEAAANAAGEVWLGLMDDGQYEKAWENAAKIMQNLVTKQNWLTLLTAKRPPLGKMVSRQRRDTTAMRTLPGAPEGQYVVIQYDTEFEHKKTARETLTIALDVGGQWRVSGYYIR